MHHRRSIRLKGYDYSQAALYFITICCQNREWRFGKIENKAIMLNDAGNIANECWLKIPAHFPHAVLHEYIIMPNHVHGIIELIAGANNHSPISPPQIDAPATTVAATNVGAENFPPLSPSRQQNDTDNKRANDTDNKRANNYSPQFTSPSKTIGSIVRGYKIGVTKWFRSNTDIETVWQRNYYEHIIRNEQSYQTISHYIINNPAKWKEDKFNNH